VEFDEAVHGFGAAVARAVGVEVAQELGAPGLEGLAEAGDLGDRARVERGDGLLGVRFPGGVGVMVVGGADLLGASPGELDLDVSVVGGPGRVQACVLSFGEVLDAGAQDVPDPIEGVVLSRVRLCGRTIESVLKESQTHGKTTLDPRGEEVPDRVERDRRRDDGCGGGPPWFCQLGLAPG
jgi:hypothetical protein